MIYEPPSPQLQSDNTLSWATFNPGDFKQDLITLPLEGALIGVMNYFYTPNSTPLWPFNNEAANKTYESTTLPRSKLLPYALGSATLILGGLTLSNNDFPLGNHGRGWLHSVLLTELSTSAAKLTFQRKRPYFDTEEKIHGTSSDGDRLSFFSGHASHAFSFATYSSALLFQYSNIPFLNWTYSTLAFSTATWIASTRVQDHAHNISDVIVGGIVGTAISAAIFYRVEQVYKTNKLNSSNKKVFQLIPFVFTDNEKNNWYGANFEINF